jgi:stage V sporulation protein G
MKITDVKVFPVDEDKLKAYATITFENCFIVRDLKVISGNKGYFIAMPSKKRKDGTFRDVAHPLNSETRKMIEEAVLEVYERENVIDPAPASDQKDDAAGAGSDEMARDEDAPDGASIDTGSDEMARDEDTPEGASIDTGSDEMARDEDTPEGASIDTGSDEMARDEDAPEGASIEAGSDEMGLEGDAAEEDTIAAEEVEGAEAFAAEAIDEETAVENTGHVEPDQLEETGKGAEENPVIEGSDDPEKAFGYEE